LYCHDNEHQRQLEAQQGTAHNNNQKSSSATYNPFADLKEMLDKEK
jgi:hypothetical protein